jgi:hypothetical protein
MASDNSAPKRRKSNGGTPSATSDDVQVMLKLYDLRREPKMREARHFISADFWPETAEDVMRIVRAYPSPENTWLRQVTSYWEMAASFVVRGGVHSGLFYDCTGEMWCVFAKFKPFLADLRQKLPYFLLSVEQVIMSTPEGRDRLGRLERRLAKRQQKLESRRAAISETSAGYT